MCFENFPPKLLCPAEIGAEQGSPAFWRGPPVSISEAETNAIAHVAPQALSGAWRHDRNYSFHVQRTHAETVVEPST